MRAVWLFLLFTFCCANPLDHSNDEKREELLVKIHFEGGGHTRLLRVPVRSSLEDVLYVLEERCGGDRQTWTLLFVDGDGDEIVLHDEEDWSAVRALWRRQHAPTIVLRVQQEEQEQETLRANSLGDWLEDVSVSKMKIRGRLPILVGVLCMAAQPLASMVWAVLIASDVVIQGQAGPAWQQPGLVLHDRLWQHLPGFMLAGFIFSSSLGVFFVHHYEVPWDTLRMVNWDSGPITAGAIYGILGAACCAFFRPQYVLASYGTILNASRRSRFSVSLLNAIILGGFSEEWVFHGVGLAALESRYGIVVAATTTSFLARLSFKRSTALVVPILSLFVALFPYIPRFAGSLITATGIVSGILLGARLDLALLLYYFQSLPAAMVARFTWNVVMVWWALAGISSPPRHEE